MAAPAGGGESVDASSINVKLTLSDVRLADVLDAIVLVADHPIKYSVPGLRRHFLGQRPGAGAIGNAHIQGGPQHLLSRLGKRGGGKFRFVHYPAAAGGSGGSSSSGGGQSGQNTGAVVPVNNPAPGQCRILDKQAVVAAAVAAAAVAAAAAAAATAD